MSFDGGSFDNPPKGGKGLVEGEAGIASSPRPATERHKGTHPAARHEGVAHHPHAHSLSDVPGLHHPHHAAAAATHGGKTGGHARRQSRTHAQLDARAGTQKLELGTITYLDAANSAVQVRLQGSQAGAIGPIPLGYGLANTATVGCACLVALLDESNPQDGIVVAVYNAPPTPLAQAGSATVAQAGSATVALGSYQQAQAVSFPTAFPNAISAVVATSRDPNCVASVSGEATTGFVLTVTRREGASQVQQGTVNVTVNAGNTSGTAPVTFPASFAVARSVVATSTLAGYCATVAGIASGGFTAGLWTPSAPGSNTTVTVEWIAAGDPAVGPGGDGGLAGVGAVETQRRRWRR